MTAALVTDTGKQFPLSVADVERLSDGMSVHQSETNGTQSSFFLRKKLGENHYRTTLIVANTHSESADILRQLQHD